MQETLSVSGALLVKTFGRQADEAATFEGTARRIRDLNVRRAMIGRWFGMSMGLFGSITPAVVYWYGGRQVIGGGGWRGPRRGLPGGGRGRLWRGEGARWGRGVG